MCLLNRMNAPLACPLKLSSYNTWGFRKIFIMIVSWSIFISFPPCFSCEWNYLCLRNKELLLLWIKKEFDSGSDLMLKLGNNFKGFYLPIITVAIWVLFSRKVKSKRKERKTKCAKHLPMFQNSSGSKFRSYIHFW